MNFKIKLLNILFFLNLSYFIKAAPNYSPNTAHFNITFIKHSPNNNTNNTEKLLSDFTNKIELRLESLINEKFAKIEEILINEKFAKIEEINKVNHGHTCSNITKPRSCNELKGRESNIYYLMLPEVNCEPFQAPCDLNTLGGGWTIIQRRQDGSENFYRNWTDYVEGFGNVNGEFFLGLNKIHALTTSDDPQELYIMLEDFKGVKKFARYGEFKVDSESNDFKLTVSQYSGNAGDSLTDHNNMKFSTRDRDNDKVSWNCAERWKGSWWYVDCFYSNLNGPYYTEDKIKSAGVEWYTFNNRPYYSLKFTQMMVRPKGN